MDSATHRLSDTLLRELGGSPTTKNTLFSDGGNLSIRHSTSGLLAWYFTYRAGTSRQVSPERLRLGSYPDPNLEATRGGAIQCHVWLAEGKNPRCELNRTIQDALTPVAVKEALTYWLESYTEERRADYESPKSRISKHIINQIGALPLERCELRHWLACFGQMAKRNPISAGFLPQVRKQTLKYCRKRRYAISNIPDDMVVGDARKKAEMNECVLTSKELGELLRTLDDKIFPPYYSALVRLLIVFGYRTTGLRRSGVRE